MSSAFTPIKGKCTWWRESAIDEDTWDARIKDAEKRVQCSCFVEGLGWTYAKAELPDDCPDRRRCRYYIRHI